jgi:hypothetical protein
MRLRLLVVVLAIAASFAAGLVSSSARWSPWAVREARAQSAPFAASVYVPSDGLAFRTFDGRLVARLAYDGHGGFFELYDEHEQLSGRVRNDALARNPSAGAAPAPQSAPRDTPAQRAHGADLGF